MPRIVVKKIINATRALAHFPRSGRKVPEFNDEDVRELIVYSYRLVYRLTSEGILVAAIIHGRRNLQ